MPDNDNNNNGNNPVNSSKSSMPVNQSPVPVNGNQGSNISQSGISTYDPSSVSSPGLKRAIEHELGKISGLKSGVVQRANEEIKAIRQLQELGIQADNFDPNQEISKAKSKMLRRTSELEYQGLNDLSSHILTTANPVNVAKETTTGSLRASAFLGMGSNVDQRRGTMMQSSARIESSIEKNEEVMSKKRRELASLISQKAPVEQINTVSEEMESAKSQTEILKRTLKEKKLHGIDESQLLKGASDRVEAFKAREEKQSLRVEAASMSPEQAAKNFKTVTESLEAAMKRLADAKEAEAKETDTSSENFKRLSTEVKNASRSVSDLQKEYDKAKYKERASQENRSDNYRKYMSFGSAAVKAIGAEDALSLGADIRKMNASTGVINRTNQMYFDSRQAIFGDDVSAMMSVMNAQTAASMAEKHAQETNVKSRAVGGVLLDAAGGAVTGARVAGKAGAVAGAVSGVASSAAGVQDAFNGTTQMNIRNQTFDALMAYQGADKAIQVSNMQAYYSHNLGLYNQAQGLGGGGRGLRKALNDKGTLDALAEVGVSGSEASQMMGLLRSAGSFKSDDAVKIMQTAGEAARIGSLSKSEYTNFGAQILGVGGQAESLKDALTFAVEHGMDNSKQIGELVQASMNMSSELGSRGIAAYDVTQQSLMSSMAQLDKMGVDKNLLLGTSQRGMMTADQAFRNSDVNLPNIEAIHKLRKHFGSRLTDEQIKEAVTLGAPEQAIMRKAMGPNATEADKTALKNLGYQTGLYYGMFDEKGNIDTGGVNAMLGASSVKISKQSYGIGASGKNFVYQDIEAMQAEIAGGKLSPEEFIKRMQSKEMMAAKAANPGAVANLFAMYGEKDLQRLSPEKQKEYKALQDSAKNDAAAGRDVTAAGAENMIREQGKQFAETLSKNQQDAMKTITDLMSTLKDTYIKNGADLSKKAGDTGQIVTDLTKGAQQFKSIMDATTKMLKERGIDIPMTEKEMVEQHSQSEVKTWTRR